MTHTVESTIQDDAEITKRNGLYFIYVNIHVLEVIAYRTTQRHELNKHLGRSGSCPARRMQGPQFKIPLPISFVPPTHKPRIYVLRFIDVGPTVSELFRVLKMLTPHGMDGRTDGHLIDRFLPRDAMHKRGLCCHAVCVRLFVTFVNSVKTSNRILGTFYRHLYSLRKSSEHRRVANCQTILVLHTKPYGDIPTWTP